MFEQRDIPFTHWVASLVDDVTVEAAIAEFPPSSDPRWHTFHAAHENNKSQHPEPFGPATASLLERFTSPEFTVALEELTGIAPLQPDLLGGGCHQTSEGGHLDVHVDFNQHPSIPGWRRALNLLVYLNPSWQPGDGGELELWDGAEARTVIEPTGAVLFPTGDHSWHGHPNPTKKLRRSIAVYFFTPGAVERPHSTEWLRAS